MPGPVRMCRTQTQSPRQRIQEPTLWRPVDAAASSQQRQPILHRDKMIECLLVLAGHSFFDSNSLALLLAPSSAGTSRHSNCPVCILTSTPRRSTCSSHRLRTNNNMCPHCDPMPNTHSHSSSRMFVLREAGRCSTARESEVTQELSREYFGRKHNRTQRSTYCRRPQCFKRR